MSVTLSFSPADGGAERSLNEDESSFQSLWIEINTVEFLSSWTPARGRVSVSLSPRQHENIPSDLRQDPPTLTYILSSMKKLIIIITIIIVILIIII